MSKGIKYGFFLVFMLPCLAYGQVLDTAGELKQLVTELKNYKSMGYSYVKTAEFPNNDKDKIAGALYTNNEERFYYNDCDASLMIVSDHWFYYADHRKKTLTVIDLDKKENKAAKESLKKQFFNNDLMNTFFDSVLLKKAIMKKFKQQDTLLVIRLVFPKSEIPQQLDMVYNWKNHMPVSYDMTTFQPMQKTDKGIKGVTAAITCSHFKTTARKENYELTHFFSYEQGKIKVKKYNNYKLSTKM